MSGAPRRIVLLSDLHMSAGGRGHPSEHFTEDAALATFLRALAAGAREAGPLRVVLLGDVFDFIDAERQPGIPRARRGSADAAVHALDGIARAHPTCFEALGALAAEAEVVLVPGNHDAELHHEVARARLATLLGRVPVSFEPLVHSVPGVLHAEHGHRHHDLNAFVAPEHPLDRRGDVEQPPGAWVHRALVARAEGRPAGVARAALGLAAAAAAAPVRSVRTLARAAAAALGRDDDPAAYMRAAIDRLHTRLARAGSAPPVYVTAHTHVAARRELRGPPAAVHIGLGTWSTLRHAGDAGELTFAEIDLAGGAPASRLMRFDPVAGSSAEI